MSDIEPKRRSPIRAKLGRDPRAWVQPDFPPWIRTVPLPHAALGRRSIAGASLTGLVLLGLFAVLIAIPAFKRGISSLTIRELIAIGIVLLTIIVIFVYHGMEMARERRFLTRRLRSTQWAPTLEVLQTARPVFRRAGSRNASRTWRSVSDSFSSRAIERPRTVADLRLATELNQLPLDDELLEPEKIIAGSRYDRRARRNMIINGIVAVAIGILSGAVACAVIGGLMIAIPLLSLQRMRASAPDLQLGRSTTIAGPGFLVFSEQLVFRSDSALCLVRSIGSVRDTDPAVEAWFYSPDAIRMLSFPSVHDPQFVRLWKRWNHPHPRGELAGTA